MTYVIYTIIISYLKHLSIIILNPFKPVNRSNKKTPD